MRSASMRETSYSRSIRRRNRAADSISIRSNCNLEEVHDDQSQDDDDVDYDKDSARNDDEVKEGGEAWGSAATDKCCFLK